MPYVIVTTEKTELEHLEYCAIPAERSFTDRAAAYRACQAIEPAKSHHVIYHETDNDRAEWREREEMRFISGAYQKTPWHDTSRYYEHFAHLSVKTPGKIAYTPSSEHGFQDRQVTLNPGRYLEQFYPAVSRDVRAAWVAQCDAAYITLAIATTADEIEAVYRGSDWTDGDECPIRSCMGPDCHATFETHPTRAYGDSDLALAYIGPADKAIARCIIWPDRKLFGRVYDGSKGTLKSLLQSAGYTYGSMTGAHIRAIESGSDNGGPSDSLLMPYVDSIVGVVGKIIGRRTGHKGTWIKIGTGSIDLQHGTDGWTRQNDSRCCDHCGDEYEYDDDNDSGYCSSCEDSRQYCDSCESDTFGTDYHYSAEHNTYICENCARSDRHTCLNCDDTWYEPIEFNQQEQHDRVRDGSAGKLCRECQETHRVCRECDIAIDIDAVSCPECSAVPRCKHTADLFAAIASSPADPIL